MNLKSIEFYNLLTIDVFNSGKRSSIDFVQLRYVRLTLLLDFSRHSLTIDN